MNKMKYDEKDIDEYLNKENVKATIETNAAISAIIQLLIDKDIITEEEILEMKDKFEEIIKNKAKEEMKQIIENGEV